MLNAAVRYLSIELMDFVPEVVLRGLEGDVSALSLRSNSLVSGGSDGTVTLWDLATRRESITLRAAHNQTVLSCGILRDSFFSSGRDGIVRLWDLHTGQCISSWETKCLTFCRTICIDEERSLLASCCEESKLSILDARTGITPCSLASNGKSRGMITAIGSAGCQKSREMFIGYEDGSVQIFDIHSNKFYGDNTAVSTPVLSISQSSEYKCMALGSADPTVNIFDYLWEEDQVTLSPQSHFSSSSGTADTSIRKDGRVLASCHWSGDIFLFDIKKRKTLKRLSYHSDKLHAISFDLGDSNWFASGGSHGEIALWNVF